MIKGPRSPFVRMQYKLGCPESALLLGIYLNTIQRKASNLFIRTNLDFSLYKYYL